MAKSIRTAFIRVSATNNTENGPVNYTYDDIKNIVLEWSKSKKFKYYIKDHNFEPGDENPHFHLVLAFNSPTPFKDVKQKFPYGDIENAKSIKNCVQYLVHMNDLSKVSYNFDEIFTNDPNIDKFKLMSATNQLLKLDDYLNQIENGIIREFNLTDKIPVQIFANHKAKIMNALEYYRRKIMTDKDRNINVILMSGPTGTYKTTYAKEYAKNLHKSICVSSSSNDPFQDYQGEDIILLDDLRDDAFKFADMLKILDNHTKSTAKSRFNNKAFIGDTIIITSSQDIHDWYFNEQKEQKEQLYRRIPNWLKFEDKWISVYRWNPQAHKYVFLQRLPNVATFKPQEGKEFLVNMLSGMGIKMSEEVKNNILKAEVRQGFDDKSIGEALNILDKEDKPVYQVYRIEDDISLLNDNSGIVNQVERKVCTFEDEIGAKEYVEKANELATESVWYEYRKKTE